MGELEALFELAEEGCECTVERHNVVIVFTDPGNPYNKLAPRNDSVFM